MEGVSTVSDEQASELHRDIDQLKADLRRIRLEFSGLAGDALRTAKDGAAQAKDRITDKAKAAAAHGRESVEALGHQVAEHPFVSLAAAFGIGMVVGLVVSRKE